MNITRRALLGATTILMPAGLLTRRARASGTVAPSQVATDANLIATGLLAVDASLQSIVPPVDPTTLKTISGYLTTVQADAATIAAQTTNAGTTVASEFISVVQAVGPIIIGLFPGGGAALDIAQAALDLLPSVATVFGLAGAKPGAPPPKFAAADARTKLASAKLLLAHG